MPPQKYKPLSTIDRVEAKRRKLLAQQPQAAELPPLPTPQQSKPGNDDRSRPLNPKSTRSQQREMDQQTQNPLPPQPVPPPLPTPQSTNQGTNFFPRRTTRSQQQGLVQHPQNNSSQLPPLPVPPPLPTPQSSSQGSDFIPRRTTRSQLQGVEQQPENNGPSSPLPSQVISPIEGQPPIPNNRSSVTRPQQYFIRRSPRRHPRQQELFPPPPPPTANDTLHQQSQNIRPPAPPISFTPEPEQNGSSTPSGSTCTTATSPLKIRCRNLTEEEKADVNRKQRRGIVVSRTTEDLFRKLGHRIPVEYSSIHKGPASRKMQGQIARDIGSRVRAKLPMLAPSYNQLSDVVPDAGLIVYSTLSTWYDLPLTSGEMLGWIEKQAETRYRQWKSDCQHHYDVHGDALPFEFLDRPNEWQWLVNHFNTPQQKAKCARLKKTRNETVRPRHHSGTVPFSYRSEAHQLKGEPAPIIKTIEEVYQADPLAAPLVEKLNAKVKAIVDQLLEERGDDVSDDPVTVPVSTQLSVVCETVPQTRGTSISGVGASIQRSPKKRGGPRVSVANEEILRHKDEIRELKELVAQQSDKLSQQSDQLSQQSELMKFFHQKLMAMDAATGRAVDAGQTIDIASKSCEGAPEVRQE